METNAQDIRCSKIQIGVRQLKEELSTELVTHILELKENSSSKENFNQLLRIERATDQYLRRTNNLFYIGFLGHFSSGKSSTINNVLLLQGTKDEKKTAHNPTDDQITLISDIRNNPDVIKMTRSGKVPVVILNIEGNDFLVDKVIMDTPGSGDPSTYEEIIRDSLPVYDLIIYCMAATHPFTNADIPVLREKERNLANIPTIYLVTRANEFKRDNLKHLDDSNFNSAKYQAFAAELAARIKNVVPSIALDASEFVAIDNMENYRLEVLMEKINFYCNPSNYGNILRLHDHKIDYFIRSLKEIKSFFLSLIIEKLETVEKFFSQAKVNIEDYDKKTRIGTDKMINSWRTIDDKIKQAVDGSINQNNGILQTLVTPSNYLELDLVKDWHFRQESFFNSKYSKLVDEYKSALYSKLADIKEKLKEQLFADVDNQGLINSEDAQTLLNTLIQGKIKFVDTVSYDLIVLYNDINKKTFEYLVNTLFVDLKKQIESLKSRTKSTNPIDTIVKQVEEAKGVLNEIFLSYKDGVKIYTVAAFSVEARNYIRKLGLSSQLDQLDLEEPDMLTNLKETEQVIFKDFSFAKEQFEKHCLGIHDKLQKIQINHPVFDSNTDSSLISTIERSTIKETNDKVAIFESSMSNRIRDHFVTKVDKIYSALLTLIVARDTEIKRLEKKRFRYYLLWFWPTAFVLLSTLVFFFVLPRFNIPNNLSLGNQWLLGIFVNLTSGIINYLVTSKRDKHPVYKEEVQGRFVQNEKEVIASIIDEDFNDFRFNIINEITGEVSSLKQSQTKQVLEHTLSKDFLTNNVNIFTSFLNVEKTLKTYIADYSKALTSLKFSIHEIMNNTEKNKKALLSQSLLIKDNSINPSFALLLKTKNEISEVKAKIERVEFD